MLSCCCCWNRGGGRWVDIGYNTEKIVGVETLRLMVQEFIVFKQWDWAFVFFLEQCSCSRLISSFISLRQLRSFPLVGIVMPLGAIFVKRHNSIHSENNQFRAAHIVVTSDLFLEYLEAREWLIGVRRCNGDGKCSSCDMVWLCKMC